MLILTDEQNQMIDTVAGEFRRLLANKATEVGGKTILVDPAAITDMVTKADPLGREAVMAYVSPFATRRPDGTPFATVGGDVDPAPAA